MRQTAVMIWKELTQVSNRPRFALHMALIASALALTFVLMAYGEIYRSPGQVTYRSMAEFGRWFFWTATAVLAVALGMSVLVIASGIVISEHVNRRLALLFVTPLSSAAIIGAKAVSVFARAAVGLMLGLPVFVMLQIFGGVDRRMVIESALFIFSNVWLYGSLGLFCSVCGKKTVSAFAWAAGLFLAWNLVPLFYLLGIYLALSRSAFGNWFWSDFSRYIYSLSPIFTFVEGFLEGGGAKFTNFHACANAVAGSLLMALAFISFRPVAKRLIAGVERRPRRRIWQRLAGKKRAPLPSAPRVLSRLLGSGVVAKELSSWRPRTAFFSLAWFAVVLGFTCLVSVATGDWPGLFDANDQSALFLAEQVGFMFILAVQSATRVAREKEARTLQGLVVTRLSRFRILAGKALALLIAQGPAVVFLTAHLSFILYLGLPQYWFGWLLLPGLFFSMFFSIVLGFYYSVAAKRVVTAVVLSGLTWAFAPLAAIGLLMVSAVVLGGIRSAPSHPVLEDAWLSVTGGQIAVMGTVALAAVVYLGRRRGYGAWLSVASYLLIIQAVSFWFLMRYGQRQEVDAMERLFEGAFYMLPGPFVLAVSGAEGLIYGGVFVLAQVCLFVWMVATSIYTFESQARRAY